MSKDKGRYLSIEAPDTRATIDFLGKHGLTVTVTLEKNRRGRPEVYVKVVADDDVNTILGEIVAEVPESDDRR